MCINYYKLNKVPIHNESHYPSIDDPFDQLQGDVVFSKIDLKLGYRQLKIMEEYIQKTSFQTRYGHYEYLVMSFELANAITAFMSLVNGVLCYY